jgi:hypothetical protein
MDSSTEHSDESTQAQDTERVWGCLRGLAPLSISAVGFLLIALGLACQVSLEWSLWSALYVFGKTVEGTVVQVKEEIDDEGVTYTARYEYWINGTRYVESGEISPEQYRQRHAGDTVTVRYIRFSPSTSRIEGNTYVANYLSLGLFWSTVLGFTIALPGVAAWRPPETALGRRRLWAAFVGGSTTSLALLPLWLVGSRMFKSLGMFAEIAEIGLGLLAGVVAASLAWALWRSQPE